MSIETTWFVYSGLMLFGLSFGLWDGATNPVPATNNTFLRVWYKTMNLSGGLVEGLLIDAVSSLLVLGMYGF